jgi:sulfur-carrier protein
MTVKILYFAALRETLGTDREDFDLPPGVETVAQLRTHLVERGGAWEALGERKSLRAAVNQTIASPGQAVKDGDEVAFFPPVTGG